MVKENILETIMKLRKITFVELGKKTFQDRRVVADLVKRFDKNPLLEIMKALNISLILKFKDNDDIEHSVKIC
jgi:hypothetical protein